MSRLVVLICACQSTRRAVECRSSSLFKIIVAFSDYLCVFCRFTVSYTTTFIVDRDVMLKEIGGREVLYGAVSRTSEGRYRLGEMQNVGRKRRLPFSILKPSKRQMPAAGLANDKSSIRLTVFV